MNRSNDQQPKQKVPYKRSPPFDDDEEKQLLIIWASTAVQNMFKTRHMKHKIIYEYIAREHNKSGKYNRTENAVTSKIKNCKSQYRNCKPRSGGSPVTWEGYNIIHQILGQKDSSTMQHVDDSLRPAENHETEDNSQQEEHVNLLSDDEPKEESDKEDDTNIINESLQSPEDGHANLRFQRITRPPRRQQSKESILIDTLLENRRIDEERYKKAEENHAKAEEREKMLTNGFSEFLNVATLYMKHAMKEKGFESSSQNSTLHQSQDPFQNPVISNNNNNNYNIYSDFNNTQEEFSRLSPVRTLSPIDQSQDPFQNPVISNNNNNNDNIDSDFNNTQDEFSRLSPVRTLSPIDTAGSYLSLSPYKVDNTILSRLSPTPSPPSALSPIADNPLKLKVPRFSPAPLKIQKTLKMNCDDKIQIPSTISSKFKPKVKSNITCKQIYRVVDIRKKLFSGECANGEKSATQVTEKENFNCEDKSNGTAQGMSEMPAFDEVKTSCLLSVLDDSSDESDSFQAVNFEVGRESIKHCTEKEQSPSKERSVNVKQSKSPHKSPQKLWRFW